MKANEVPEKIIHNGIEYYRVDTIEDITVDGEAFVKKDACIEKACEFISLNAADYVDVTHKGGIEHLALQERFIDEFRKYMEQ